MKTFRKSFRKVPEVPEGQKGGPQVHLVNLLTCLHVSHLTWQVQSQWEERGGIMLVAPPGQLKTTVVGTMDRFPDCHVITDINVKSMCGIRDLVLAHRYRTLAIGEMEKLYARNPATSSNIEGYLRQFCEEGVRHFSYEDASSPIMPARCMIISGMTPSLFARYSGMWRENGFLRRFLQIHYVLKDEKALLNSIHKWEKLEIKLPTQTYNGQVVIPYNLDSKESKFVMDLLKEQPSTTPLVLLKKIAVILKHGKAKEWKHILTDLAPSFGKNGAMLEV